MNRSTLLSILITAMTFAATARAADAQSPSPNSRHGLAVTFAEQVPLVADSPFGPAEQQNWIAQVEWQAFQRVTDAEGQVARLAARPLVGHSVEVDLPGVGPVLLRVTGLTELVDGVSTVSGVFAQDSASVFTLSYHGGRVLGSIRDRTHNWVIEPDGATHRLRKIERRLIPRISDAAADVVEIGKSAKAPTALSKTGGGGRVDILFLHASNVSNASSIASDIISNMNSALSTSLVSSNNYVASAGIQQINDDFDDDSRQTILNLMRLRQAPFVDLVSDLMFNANADIAFLIVEEDAGASDIPVFGRVGGIASTFVESEPFGLSTDDYALGDYTALHEIGHVFNGKHEDFTGGSNRGKVASDDSWQTVMGGYVECSFNGLPADCERIRYFSNPDVTYSGTATGDVGSRDMESALESSMVTVSSWRDNGDPVAPGIPSSISTISESCYGFNTIDWAAVSGATAYRLYESSSSAFTSPSVIYTGSDTEAVVTVPAWSTRYYRVRACNSSGCSNFTAQVSASYFNGCL